MAKSFLLVQIFRTVQIVKDNIGYRLDFAIGVVYNNNYIDFKDRIFYFLAGEVINRS